MIAKGVKYIRFFRNAFVKYSHIRNIKFIIRGARSKFKGLFVLDFCFHREGMYECLTVKKHVCKCALNFK